MKLCPSCGLMLAEGIHTCPSCGSGVGEGLQQIDDYRILQVLHEGYASILCRALKTDGETPVMLRIFTRRAGVDQKIADRLKKELEEIQKLPEAFFVQHYEIRRSSEGLWYRVSEWIDAENWGTLLAAGVLNDYSIAFRLFAKTAAILEGLHRIGHFIPHLILDDIIVFKDSQGELQVKIDYKLSRFLDPKMDRPGPTLNRLLQCHPDIIHRRPLDHRTDIWSLGKTFVELLTADFAGTDFLAGIEDLALPEDIEVLLKIMLADDPNLRPGSMAEIAEAFSRITKSEVDAAMRRRSQPPPPAQEISGLKRRVGFLALLVVILVVGGAAVGLYYFYRQSDSEAVLSKYANRYAESVAFVLVDYWLENDGQIVYRNRIEGTAFLVDNDGRLLTNRHVACPWLEDDRLSMVVETLRRRGGSPRMDYRIFLWFEGQKAFKRLPDVAGTDDLEDLYFIEHAFRSDLGADRPRRLYIVGVARSPQKTWQQIKSPLKDDFAVLQTHPVPADLHPLPLDSGLKPLEVPKLLPVIALGFPLGSRSLETTVNASVTQGHVRRAFQNFLQVDTSLYRGNSGGPIIDIHGNVIGIASSVAMEWSIGPMPTVTMLSDLGMVLPIDKAAAFLTEIKAGKPKWNGVLDLTIEDKLNQITAAARRKDWKTAKALANRELQTSLHPLLVMASAMMHFCDGDWQKAARLFDRTLSMDEDNGLAQFMCYLIDWREGRALTGRFRNKMVELDWRSPYEFYGHLVRVLEDKIDAATRLGGGFTAFEKSWLHYVAALKVTKHRDLVRAERLLQKALLFSDPDQWGHYLALAALDKLQQSRLAECDQPGEKQAYLLQVDQFNQTMQQARAEQRQRKNRIEELQAEITQGALSPPEKRRALVALLKLDPLNSDTLVSLIFFDCRHGAWQSALENARAFQARAGRESRWRLQVGLLEPQILLHAGSKEIAVNRLLAFKQRIHDPWYRAIAECLMGEKSEEELVAATGESLDYVLTAHAALGLWREGHGDGKRAMAHYREALSSFLDEQLEYGLAVARLKKLKQTAP